jgi:hypothetical protein
VAVRTRLGSLFPFGEGMKAESEGRPNARRGVYVVRCVIAWLGRRVVLIVLAGRSGSRPWDRREMLVRLVRPTSRRLRVGRIGSEKRREW